MKKLIIILLIQFISFSVSADMKAKQKDTSAKKDNTVLGVWCTTYGGREFPHRLTKSSIQARYITGFNGQWKSMFFDDYSCNKDYTKCIANKDFEKSHFSDAHTKSYTFTRSGGNVDIKVNTSLSSETAVPCVWSKE